MSSNNSSGRVEQRATDRAERDAIRAKRSPQSQLKVLDGRLGVNVGAKRERLRMRALIEQS